MLLRLLVPKHKSGTFTIYDQGRSRLLTKLHRIINHDAGASSSENWSNKIDSAEVLDEMDKMPGEKWAPVLRELVKLTPPKTIVNFEVGLSPYHHVKGTFELELTLSEQLLWRNPQPTWVSPSARVIQIGDAAHSFLPASSNGATQAVEDAVTIATCLQIAGKDNIPDAVRAHMRFRYALLLPLPCPLALEEYQMY